MTIGSMDYLQDLVRRRAIPVLLYRRLARSLRISTTKLTLTILSVILLCGSIAAYSLQSSFLASRAGRGYTCGWYTVEAGDTLTNIARLYHTTISTLVYANAIRDANLIFVGWRLCIPHHPRPGSAGAALLPNGTIRWYDYRDLDWSNRRQVHAMLYRAAAAHHLPAKLLLAIAWQESGWTQHVIAQDGGIGVMQLMPYTAMGINTGIRQKLNPYQLWDNLKLGATYLQWLWRNFHGNLVKVISAYNEGGWAVRHQGIFNWRYVNNVLSLMRKLR